MREDCIGWMSEKTNKKKKNFHKQEQKEKGYLSVKIEEINTFNEAKAIDFFLMSRLHANMTAKFDFVKHDWIIDSKEFFYVTPRKSWLTTYDAT